MLNTPSRDQFLQFYSFYRSGVHYGKFSKKTRESVGEYFYSLMVGMRNNEINPHSIGRRMRADFKEIPLKFFIREKSNGFSNSPNEKKTERRLIFPF